MTKRGPFFPFQTGGLDFDQEIMTSYCSIVTNAPTIHRFVYIGVLLVTGNDVIAKSPPGGAAGDSYKQSPEGKL